MANIMRSDLHPQNSRRNIRQPSSDNLETLGFLACAIRHSDMQAAWFGAQQAAREQHVNLIHFDGGVLRDPCGYKAQANVLYTLINPEAIAGLVVYSAALDWAISPAEMADFLRQYHPLPIVTIETAFPGIPVICIDNYQGMRAVMLHLLKEHGYRRIAFVRGPEGHIGAQERYRAYCETTAAYGCLDLNLAGQPGPWEERHGAETVQFLIDDRQVAFDAIVGACDDFAIGALHELHRRGIQVPGIVATAGFDDYVDGQAATPPITTSRVPFYQIGYQAIETLCAMRAGQMVSQEIPVRPVLVVRQSCGCADPNVIRVAARPETDSLMEPIRAEMLDTVLRSQHAQFVGKMLPVVESFDQSAEWVQALVEAFLTDIQSTTTGQFLHALDRLLRHVADREGDVLAWQDVMSVFRQQLTPFLREVATLSRAEDLWHQARVLIGATAQRVQLYQTLQVEHKTQTLSEFSQALLTTFNMQELMQVLAEGLPQLGIARCLLSVYDDPARPTEGAILRLAYDETGRKDIDPDARHFRAGQLAPDGLLSQMQPFSLLLEALYFQDAQIGFILFDAQPSEGKMYELLRGEISSALQGALLMQRVQQHQNHLEELVAERTGEITRVNACLRNEIVERKRGEAEITRINACLRDEILERKRVEQVLRVSEQQYRLLAENEKDGLVIVQANRIVFVNHALAAMLNTSVDQLLWSDPRTLFTNDAQRTLPARLLASTVESGGGDSVWQLELVTHANRTIWTEIAQTAIVWNTQNALLLTVRNINQSKLRELRLEEERVRLRQENLLFKSAIADRYRFGPLIGKSAAMQRVYDLILSAASSDANVFIIGESGTGKELIARTIHHVSRRKAHPFVPVNCAAIPETMFEREFFGHRKGAFTGADRNQPGLFDRAQQGVLFLDEVTELTPGMQAKLLRVLQDGEYTPLGSNAAKQADVLIVAATNKDYQVELGHGRLRRDFFYRIGVIEIAAPPLRQRKEDLPLLIEHLVECYWQKQAHHTPLAPDQRPVDQTSLPGELIQALLGYAWPGNVRELQNILHRYLATHDLAAALALMAASENMRALAAPSPAPKPRSIPLPDLLAETEKHIITEMLAQHQYRTSIVAQNLGIPLRTLQKKLQRYHLLEKRQK